MSIRLARRLSRLVVTAVLVGLAISAVIFGIIDWHLHDMQVYEAAALRLRSGDQLYGGPIDPNTAYRYAPWFAFAFAPLTYLPDLARNVLWSVFLLGGSALALVPLARERRLEARLLLVFLAAILFGISSGGNIQGPMLAMLVWGMPTRWGGLVVGIAASLKVVPIALAAVFIAERRWSQLAYAVVAAIVLWAPIVLFEIDPITLDPGLARTLPTWGWVLVAASAAIATVAMALFAPRYTALSAATAAILALPRLFVYEITLLVAGLHPVRDARAPQRPPVER
ncbi:MAG: glycosyltransferase family 87 protein [Candidatus Limnocylindria bacterium]